MNCTNAEEGEEEARMHTCLHPRTQRISQRAHPILSKREHTKYIAVKHYAPVSSEVIAYRCCNRTEISEDIPSFFALQYSNVDVRADTDPSIVSTSLPQRGIRT